MPPLASFSIRARVALALALMAGFYLLAIGIVAGLLWLSYAIIIRNNIIFTLPPFLIAIAGIILWSVLPRRDPFVPPGPRLEEKDHPRLFDVIREVADQTGQAMPSDVYLVLQMNAMVAQHGGIGARSTRVMAIGLPLLQYLTVPELKAVLVHEFGHFYAGDTRLGPWMYQTRAAMERTIRTLGKNNDVLSKPFVVYGTLFMRITQAVSRRQEYVGDALAARIMGLEHSRNALLKLAAGDRAFRFFYQEEVVPALNEGYLPSLTEGFARFMTSSRVSEWVEIDLKEEMANQKLDPYATHPPLPARLEALGVSSIVISKDDEPRAVTLVDDIGQLERLSLASVSSPEATAKLQPIAWDDVACKVLLPKWNWIARYFGPELDGVTIGSMHEISTTPSALRVRFGYMSHAPEDLLRNDLGPFLTQAMQAALVREGWTVQTAPGEPIDLVGPKGTVRPSGVVRDLLFHKVDSAGWERMCAELDMGSIELGGGGELRPGEDLWPMFLSKDYPVKKCSAKVLKRARALLDDVFGEGGSGFSDSRLYGRSLAIGPFLWDAIQEHAGIGTPSPMQFHNCERRLLPLRLRRAHLARCGGAVRDDGTGSVRFARFTDGRVAEAAAILVERYQGFGKVSAVRPEERCLRLIGHWAPLREPAFMLSLDRRHLLVEFDEKGKLAYVDDYSTLVPPAPAPSEAP